MDINFYSFNLDEKFYIISYFVVIKIIFLPITSAFVNLNTHFNTVSYSDLPPCITFQQKYIDLNERSNIELECAVYCSQSDECLLVAAQEEGCIFLGYDTPPGLPSTHMFSPNDVFYRKRFTGK